MNPRPAAANGRLTNLVPWIGIVLSLAIPYFGGVFSMRDRMTVVESRLGSLASSERVAVIEADLRAIQRGQDLRARDVAGILHQPGDRRGADRLIGLYQAGTATLSDLVQLRDFMRQLGGDHTQDEGLRSAALELARSCDDRIAEKGGGP